MQTESQRVCHCCAVLYPGSISHVVLCIRLMSGTDCVSSPTRWLFRPVASQQRRHRCALLCAHALFYAVSGPVIMSDVIMLAMRCPTLRSTQGTMLDAQAPALRHPMLTSPM
eukprot:2524030-Rhodomonas_salina.1